MWVPLDIERKLEQALLNEFGEAEGQTLFGEYTAVRAKLPDIIEEIKRREPNLTDHGPRHIRDVLGQAHQLLPDGYFDPRELLALMLSVLFHDTGNIHGRIGHEKKISDIHSFVRGTPLPARLLEEKKMILAIVGAHGGEARDGSKDTIKDLTPTETYLRRPIRIREIAAVLRFADELAEGPHRTSEYLRRRHEFPIEVEKYHDYASITSICIDPALDRIALTYQINLFSENGVIGDKETARLERLLAFAYHRIRKLDEERQYARYYCPALAPFKKTSATFNFWIDDEPKDLNLMPIELDDLVVPGGDSASISKIFGDYEIATIVSRLKASPTVSKSKGGASNNDIIINPQNNVFGRFLEWLRG